MSWEIDEDISRAGTIDPRIHTDAALHQRCVERALLPSWQLVPFGEPAHAVTPFTLLAGSLDEPLVLTRDGEAERVLSNVCTHRGALLADVPPIAPDFAVLITAGASTWPAR